MNSHLITKSPCHSNINIAFILCILFVKPEEGPILHKQVEPETGLWPQESAHPRCVRRVTCPPAPTSSSDGSWPSLSDCFWLSCGLWKDSSCVCVHVHAHARLGTNASNQSPSLGLSYKNYKGKIRTRNQAILYSSKALTTSVYTKYMIRCSWSFHWDYYSTHLRKTYWREWGLKEF